MAFVAVGAFAGLLMSGIISREVVSDIEVINANGGKVALVVYQPGFSSFPRDSSFAFADGLASSGWRVEVTTASSQTLADLSKYALLVFGYPVYGGSPGTAVVNYVNRVHDLNGIRTVILACGGGENGETLNPPLKQQVLAANGTFYKGLSLSNQGSSATDLARQTGSNITP